MGVSGPSAAINDQATCIEPRGQASRLASVENAVFVRASVTAREAAGSGEGIATDRVFPLLP